MVNLRHKLNLCLLAFLPVLCAGCQFTAARKDNHYLIESPSYAIDFQNRIDYPDAHRPANQQPSFAPRTVDDGEPTDFWDMTLQEVITLALQRGKVIRDLGGRVLSNPDGMPTIFDPGIAESNPNFGPEGALSAFDVQYSGSMFWARNDFAANNAILNGGAQQILQDTGTWQSTLSKVTPTGATMSFVTNVQYDQNNRGGNLFPSSWDGQLEFNYNHPLLRGAGMKYNRIAGPSAQVGFATTSTGVLLARTNVDISLADFELNVRTFVNDIEEAYWDLYFAYRDLDAKRLARDSAEETWRSVKTRLESDLEQGEAYNEAQAREQLTLFQDSLHDALNGNVNGGQPSIGVYRGERRLRRLLGLPPNDGRLIRPKDEPPLAKVIFTWQDSINEALTRRVEIRRQMWQIRRAEMELFASKNFTLPQLDAVAQYRYRGFGDHLSGDGPRFSSALQDLASGDHQEWQLGINFGYTFGYRQAWAGVQQSKLQLARARVVLKEQELEISHGLSEAISELSRAHASLRINYDRLVAAVQRRNATRVAFEAGAERVSLDLFLQSQQRLSDAQSRYFLSLSQYAKSIKNVHLQKGSLLQYNGVYLSEGDWPAKAYEDMVQRGKRWRPKVQEFPHRYPETLTLGPYLQDSIYTPAIQAPENPEELPVPGDARPASWNSSQPSAPIEGVGERIREMNYVLPPVFNSPGRYRASKDFRRAYFGSNDN